MSSAPESSTPSSRPWVPPTAAELHALLPEYEIVKMLGRGGMGAVYMGQQIALDRPVAIKILSNTLDEADASFAERFKNEARAMARLSHPGIVAVHDFGEKDGGLLYIVMEYIEGTDVARMIAKEGRLHTEHAMAITAHVCDALAYAHGRGIIHRDIKPANVMVGNDGVVKVADFGLAKMTHSNATGLTQSGMAMGTLHYMAPEALLLGAAVDHRADLYAVGVMLYQMLTGKIPQGMFKLPSLRVAGLDPRYDGIIAKALMEEREARYQSAGELLRDLDAIFTQPVVKVEESAQEAPAALPTQARPQLSGSTAKRSLPPSSVMQPVPVPKGKVGLHEALVLMGSVILFGGMLIGGLVWLTQPRGQPTEATRLAQEKTTAEEKQRQLAAAEAARISKEKTDTVEKQRQMAVQLESERLLKEAEMKRQAAADVFSIGKIGDTRVVDLGSGVKLTLCYCPAGGFTMGSPASEGSRSVDEQQVQVKISHGYWLAKTECTQAQWRIVMGTDPSYHKGDDLPVECVSWELTQVFITNLNGKNLLPSGWRWSLPSEARWEYACRAGTTGPYAGELLQIAWLGGWYENSQYVSDGNTTSKTQPVGTKSANAWGLHDMHGNVAEWCLDRRELNDLLLGGTDPVKDSGPYRVIRGGFYQSGYLGGDCRSANRDEDMPNNDKCSRGFRVAAVKVEIGSATTVTQGKSESLPMPMMWSVIDPALATKEKPFINSLGMKFVPVPITDGASNGRKSHVLFSICETRVKDFEAFAKSKDFPDAAWRVESGGDDHPVVRVSWSIAGAFCQWLTQAERAASRIGPLCTYRLPTDREWSHAVGIGRYEAKGATPESLSGKLPKDFPWGYGWPPPKNTGNYSDSIEGFSGGVAQAPVMSFKPNKLGLHDVGGNIAEWCEDWYNEEHKERVVRDGSWRDNKSELLLSTYRKHFAPESRLMDVGFRCVLEASSNGN